MSKVFLCYASEDELIAKPIQLALVNAGHKVFYDKNSLPPGGDFYEKIRKAINQCDLFVFLISKNSIKEGKFTCTELKFVQERWQSPVEKVLPVNIEGIPKSDIPPYLNAITILPTSSAAEVRAEVDRLLEKSETKVNKLKQEMILLWAIAGAIGLAIGRIIGSFLDAMKPGSWAWGWILGFCISGGLAGYFFTRFIFNQNTLSDTLETAKGIIKDFAISSAALIVLSQILVIVTEKVFGDPGGWYISLIIAGFSVGSWFGSTLRPRLGIADSHSWQMRIHWGAAWALGALVFAFLGKNLETWMGGLAWSIAGSLGFATTALIGFQKTFYYYKHP